MRIYLNSNLLQGQLNAQPDILRHMRPRQLSHRHGHGQIRYDDYGCPFVEIDDREVLLYHGVLPGWLDSQLIERVAALTTVVFPATTRRAGIYGDANVEIRMVAEPSKSDHEQVFKLFITARTPLELVQAYNLYMAGGAPLIADHSGPMKQVS